MTREQTTPARAERRSQADRRATTEARLLEAAFRIVATRGVRAVTTAAAGELAGYSRGIVSHHFGSRDALMIRLAESVQRRFKPSTSAERGHTRVLGLVDDYLATVQSQPEDSRVFLRLWAAAIGDDEAALRQAFIGRDADFRELFRAAVAEGIADGSIAADIDEAATAASLVGLLRGVAMQRYVASQLISLHAVRRTVHRLLAAGLHPASDAACPTTCKPGSTDVVGR